MDEVILGIDGTGRSVEAALVRAPSGGTPHCVARLSAPSTAESVIKLVEDLLEQAGRPSVAKIAVLVGPGSFTGIRSCVATALGLSAAWGAEAVLVPFFRAALISQLAGEGGIFAPYLKANRNETFCAVYQLRRRVAGTDPRSWEVLELLAPQEYRTGDFEQSVSEALKTRGVAGEIYFFEASQGDGSAESGALAALEGSFGVPAEPGELYLKPVQAKTLRERGVFYGAAKHD